MTRQTLCLTQLAALLTISLAAACSADEEGGRQRMTRQDDNEQLDADVKPRQVDTGMLDNAGRPASAGGSGQAGSAAPTSTSSDTCGNGFDDDADGEIDEGCACRAGQKQRCYLGDRTKVGIGACSKGEQTCVIEQQGVEFQSASWGPCLGQGEKSDVDTCHDEIDNDCNGVVDEGCPCKEGAVEACDSACGPGEQVCHAGALSACAPTAPPAESCNGKDDDCDGQTDEALTRACTTACGAGSETCRAGSWSACSAAQPSAETCNGEDDDCDGRIDGFSRACNSACGSGKAQCASGSWSACDAPAPQPDTCNLRDDDCDGDIDEGLKAEWSFRNACTRSNIFVVIGGCNVCSGTCSGNWVAPGESLVRAIDQNTCFDWSGFVRREDGDTCLDAAPDGRYVGEVREFCNADCKPEEVVMNANSDC
jgi:hypothetical protein